jgi:hypothetical protein
LIGLFLVAALYLKKHVDFTVSPDPSTLWTNVKIYWPSLTAKKEGGGHANSDGKLPYNCSCAQKYVMSVPLCVTSQTLSDKY